MDDDLHNMIFSDLRKSMMLVSRIPALRISCVSHRAFQVGNISRSACKLPARIRMMQWYVRLISSTLRSTSSLHILLSRVARQMGVVDSVARPVCIFHRALCMRGLSSTYEIKSAHQPRMIRAQLGLLKFPMDADVRERGVSLARVVALSLQESRPLLAQWLSRPPVSLQLVQLSLVARVRLHPQLMQLLALHLQRRQFHEVSQMMRQFRTLAQFYGDLLRFLAWSWR
jgi:hypothetical protein